MSIQLSDHFSFGRLLRFTWPTVLVTMATSVYSLVDGLMVSNFVGTTAFAALNLIWPLVAVLGSIGFMMGTGGAALVAKVLGEGRPAEARSLFSLFTYATLTAGILLGGIGLACSEKVARMLGGSGELLEQSLSYGNLLLIMLPFYALQVYFQNLMVVAERPRLSMWITFGAGAMNIVLDFVFIVLFDWGLNGAAVATAASMVFGTLTPLAYFCLTRQNILRLGSCRLDWKALGQASLNGVSEFTTQISLSLVSFVYIWQLMRSYGENGVSAYGILMYFAFLFSAVFIGFGVGSSPVMSYHYGAGNRPEMRNVFHKSLIFVFGFGLLGEVLAQALARPLCALFVSYDPELLQLAVHAFRIYNLMLLYIGFNIYASSLFTALNNGPVSALISLSRTLVFELGCVLLLPWLVGIEGIWWAVDVAEGITLLLSGWLIWHYRPRYGY